MFVSIESEVREACCQMVNEIEWALSQPSAQLPKLVQQAIQSSFASGNWLSAEQCEGRAEGYTRHIIYEDPKSRFTIASLVWNPGQFSPVHAHYVWCALAVVEGQLTEEFYDYGKWDSAPVLKSSVSRAAGQGSSGHAGLEQIHRVGNSGERPAISVHVYGIDGARVTTHVNRIVPLVE